MESQMLEARVIAIVEAVLAGRQVEDDRVELKAQWPPAEHKVARQIAGHCNAAGGEPVLWIIGLDEKRRRLGTTAGVEPADWWNSTYRHFVEVKPEMKMLRVPVASGRDVMALQFSTDRAPYVVGVVGGGQVEREVPWRQGNATRTAHRHEMIRSMVAEAQVPILELVNGRVVVEELMRADQEAHVGDLKVSCSLSMYVSAQAPAHLPQHRQTLTVATSRGGSVDMGEFNLEGSYKFDGWTDFGRKCIPSGNIAVLGRSGVEVRGPGELSLTTSRTFGQKSEATALLKARRLALDLRLPVDLTDRTARVLCGLAFVPGTGQAEASEWSKWRTRTTFTYGGVM